MFQIDTMSRTPVYEQIIEQVESFVLKGILKIGDQVPSVRGLSIELSINPNTIQKAYSELDRRGIIYSVPGRGCYVTENALNVLSANKAGKLGELTDFIGELALAGVPKEDVIKCVDEAYDKQKSKG